MRLVMNFRQNLMRLRHWFATFRTHRDPDGKSADPYGFDKRLSESRMFLSFLKPDSLPKANWSTSAPFGILPKKGSPKNRADISKQFIFLVRELKVFEGTKNPKEFNRVRSLIKDSLQECRYRIKTISCLSDEDKLSNFTYNALLLAIDENKMDNVNNLCNVLERIHANELGTGTVDLINGYLNNPLRQSPEDNISLMTTALKQLNKQTTPTVANSSKEINKSISKGGFKPPEEKGLAEGVNQKVAEAQKNRDKGESNSEQKQNKPTLH